MKLTNKQRMILTITLTVWGIFLIISGVIMDGREKKIVHTAYEVTIEKKELKEAQAKMIDIKAKDIEIEINTPISVDIKDYIEKPEEIKEEIIKNLKLDTALVNVNQAGKYEYSISYNKKVFKGNIIVKEKELPNVQFTLKDIKIKKGEKLSDKIKDYINEELSEEAYDNMSISLPSDYSDNPGHYTYSIIYKKVTYNGTIDVEDIIEKEKEEEKNKSEEKKESETIDNKTEEKES